MSSRRVKASTKRKEPDTNEEPQTKKAKRTKVNFKIEQEDLVGENHGYVLTFGSSFAGQLGLSEDVTEKARPSLVELPSSIVNIASGSIHTLCLTKEGRVYSFGCNDDGALGRITQEEADSALPGLIDILDDHNEPAFICQISAGDSHSAALSSDGKVYAWGSFRGSSGGMGLTSSSSTPQKTPLLLLKEPHVISITSGDNHLVLLTADNKVLTYGCGEQGQLGRLSERMSQNERHKHQCFKFDSIPVPKKYNKKISKAWANSFATVVKNSNDEIAGFGLNNYRQLGEIPKNSPDAIYFPTVLPAFANQTWKEISAGLHHTIALNEEGKVYSIGRKEFGRLGLGKDTTDQNQVAIVPALEEKTCTSVSSKEVASFAVTNEGDVYSWGQAELNLGHGEIEEDVFTPTKLLGKMLRNYFIVKVSAGSQHTTLLAYKKETEDAPQ